MTKTTRAAVVQRAVPLLLLVALLLVGASLALRHATHATFAVDRIVVVGANEQDPTITQTIADLKGRGFSQKAVADLSSLSPTAARTVVFTAAALQSTAAAERHALFTQGAVLAAFDTSLPDLESAVGLQFNGQLPPSSSSWVRPTPGHVIYSIVRQVKTVHGLRTSEQSDFLQSVDNFTSILTRAEQVDREAVATLRLSKVETIVPAPYTVLGWQVADIRAEHGLLTARGVTFERYAGLLQDSSGICTFPGGAQVAWFKDPDGNVLSLTQPA
jgi:hypothetical protein